MRKFTTNENSQLFVRIKVREYKNQHGQTVIESKWIKVNREVNLGSFKEPNNKILEFKYEIPNDEENVFKSTFKGLFGGD